jgi:hypothetical protein
MPAAPVRPLRHGTVAATPNARRGPAHPLLRRTSRRRVVPRTARMCDGPTMGVRRFGGCAAPRWTRRARTVCRVLMGVQCRGGQRVDGCAPHTRYCVAHLVDGLCRVLRGCATAHDGCAALRRVCGAAMDAPRSNGVPGLDGRAVPRRAVRRRVRRAHPLLRRTSRRRVVPRATRMCDGPTMGVRRPGGCAPPEGVRRPGGCAAPRGECAAPRRNVLAPRRVCGASKGVRRSMDGPRFNGCARP